MRLGQHFKAMARNNAWSNARLHSACAALSGTEFAAARTSFFPSLQQTLDHILVVDRAYLADLVGTGRSRSGDGPPLSASELAVAQAQTDAMLIAFCDELDEAGLIRIVTIDRGEAVPSRETVEAILAHLFVHQIHHRGQVHAMLAGTRVAPPQLDEFFLAFDEPRRRHEMRHLGTMAS